MRKAANFLEDPFLVFCSRGNVQFSYSNLLLLWMFHSGKLVQLNHISNHIEYSPVLIHMVNT